ncbi:MAG: VWA domain-containing protein [Clostridia bacterium]|nr:VWA domain-containing protein [Clostridia bacterium]
MAADSYDAGYQSNAGKTNAVQSFGAEKSKEARGITYADEESYHPYDEYSTEEYKDIEESGFKMVKNSPLSTFSADVDTASYSNLRRMINDGYRMEDIPAGAVRIEEMINYFDYHYKSPRGSDPFSVTTEIGDCPWNQDTKLMMVGIASEEVSLDEIKGNNLVFLLDVSGSMSDEDKLPLLQKAFSMLADNLTENDCVSIVTYAGDDRIVLEGASGSNSRKIKKAINNLEAGGSTAGSKGIKTAYKIAEEYYIKGGNNRVILATDGDLNVGLTSESELASLIEEERETGIFLSVLGFGTDNIKDNKMETLADKGNGNYAYIDGVREAKKVLVDEMGATLLTIAKDVKFQVEFNPAIVKGYRLIGYDNRALAAEDFNDDKKDAGEVGAGHSVTALYEIVTVEDDMPKDTGIDLKYQDNNQTSKETQRYSKDMEWLTVSIRYKKPSASKSELMEIPVTGKSYVRNNSDSFYFAAAVAEFGMLLKNSEYKESISCADVIDLLEQSDIRGDEYKEEFYELVDLMR